MSEPITVPDSQPDLNQVAEDTKQAMPLIHDVLEFAHLVVGWHGNVLGQLEHLTQVPDTEVLQAIDESGVVHNFTGAEREAFIIGLHVAKSLLHKLPFTVSQEATPTTEPV